MFARGGNSDAPTTVRALDLDAGWAVDAMFGGALLRVAVDAAASAAGLRDWVAIEVSGRFVRPMTPGTASAATTVLHRGASTAVVSVGLLQDGRPGVVALVTLAPAVPVARSAEPRVLPAAAPAPPGARAAVARRVDWRVDGDWGPADGALRCWIAPRDAQAPPPPDWCCVAADLLVPALPGASRTAPVRIASISLHLSLLAAPGSVWLAQEVEARVAGGSAFAAVRLAAPDGQEVARATHRAVLRPATAAEMPFSATAFGWGAPGQF